MIKKNGISGSDKCEKEKVKKGKKLRNEINVPKITNPGLAKHLEKI